MMPQLRLPVWGVAGLQQDVGGTAVLQDSAPVGVYLVLALLTILLL